MPAKKQTTPSNVTADLDVLGVDGRVRVIQNLLAPYQQRRYELSVIQLSNDMKDDDPVPGVPAGEDGVPTFAQMRSQLARLEESIMDSVEPKIANRLKELVE